MGKKVVIAIIAILVSSLGILGYFLYQGRQNLLTDPYKVISEDACIVIETVDVRSFLNSLTTGKGMFGELSRVNELSGFNRNLKYLADLFNKPGLKEVFSDGSSVISVYTDNGRVVPLLSMPVPGDLRMRHIKEMMASTGISDFIETRKVGKHVLMIPYLSDSTTDTTYLSLVSGLLICSNSARIITSAIQQSEKIYDIRSSSGFSHVLLASGKNVDKLFIVFSNLPDLLRPFLKPEKKYLADKISRLAETAEGDIYLNDDGLVLSGYTESTDTANALYKFKMIQAKDFHTFKILPSATVLFESLIAPPAAMPSGGDTSIKKETYDLAAALKPFTGEEITRAIIDIKGNQVTDNTIIVYELKNRVEAEQIFLEHAGTNVETTYFKPDDQFKVPVYKTAFNGLVKLILPGFAHDVDEVYFAFFDQFLISGRSYETISRVLYDNLLSKTLANDLTYHDFEGTLPSRAGYYFFCVPSRITEYLENFFNEDIIKALNSNLNSLSKIQAAGYKFSSSNNMIYNSLSVNFRDVVREESTTEWETLLDTVAAIKPFFFTNHLTGAREIFIQDLKNNTYLINAAGRVLWKVPLNERITSNIYMIDYYKNSKYQLLFSGKNYLHILDRNGNYVERYPVKLRSPATNSMVLIDYDNNLNYRLFIAGQDKSIYCYDKSGSVVKGWALFKTAAVVSDDISYFKVAGKDYIVAADENSLYFLDRAGNKRFNLKEPVTKAPGSALRLNSLAEPSLVCTSKDGTIINIYFDGSVRKFSVGSFSDNHTSDFFDIDGDGFGEFIFIDKGILYLYNHNREEIIKRDFETENLGGPINFIFSATDRKIGVIDLKKNLIYLVGKNGKTMNGFPLKGASMFSIGKLSDKNGWHLIVGGTDRFLYNYKIDAENK